MPKVIIGNSSENTGQNHLIAISLLSALLLVLVLPAWQASRRLLAG
ncbi:MAG: hypothetical protein GY792_18880 [Gammaproteobacteria bacterium]|nr:hypothetical protein [Gammaproteobacteria bacterium]